MTTAQCTATPRAGWRTSTPQRWRQARQLAGLVDPRELKRVIGDQVARNLEISGGLLAVSQGVSDIPLEIGGGLHTAGREDIVGHTNA